MRRLLQWDWDAIAGILAAVAALILHFLHIIEIDILIMISLVLIALLFIRDLRRERTDEQLLETVEATESRIQRMTSQLTSPDTMLIGPHSLREETARFSRDAQGTMVWFHVCLLMFRPQPLFDVLLKPALENPEVDTIQFILDEGERDRWDNLLLPKARETSGFGKLEDPYWNTIDEGISYIMASQRASEGPEALLSFWGDPFMSYETEHEVPRYIFWVQSHSELIERLEDVGRRYRLGRG